MSKPHSFFNSTDYLIVGLKLCDLPLTLMGQILATVYPGQYPKTDGPSIEKELTDQKIGPPKQNWEAPDSAFRHHAHDKLHSWISWIYGESDKDVDVAVRLCKLCAAREAYREEAEAYEAFQKALHGFERAMER